MEIWKDIKGYDGKYQVSNLGRVKSTEFRYNQPRDNTKHVKKRNKILKDSLHPNGYRRVIIMNKSFQVHRLVGQAFIPNPHNKPQINHINGVKDDNRAENLEWVTNGENGQHAYQLGLKKKLFSNDNPYSTAVIQLDLNDNFIKKWNSIADVERYYGKRMSHISCVCSQKYGRNTAYGYKWEYFNNHEDFKGKIESIEVVE